MLDKKRNHDLPDFGPATKQAEELIARMDEAVEQAGKEALAEYQRVLSR